MIEGRKSTLKENIQPYCTQMQVLDNSEVRPIADTILNITEAESGNGQSPGCTCQFLSAGT